MGDGGRGMEGEGMGRRMEWWGVLEKEKKVKGVKRTEK